MTEQIVEVSHNEVACALMGVENKYLKLITQSFPCHIVGRGTSIRISGDEDMVAKVVRVFQELSFLYQESRQLTERQVNIVIRMVSRDKADELHSLLEDTVSISVKGSYIKPKTMGQKRYVDGIRNNTICFGIGPAGTGKTFLAVALAAYYLKNKDVDRIILTRPAVEAGEKLGYLPGDLQEKVDPYLRPLYDALHDMFGLEQVQRFMEKGVIEVAPLAYMRGRTLDRAFIILDEAQNTTPEQMKMFLTRLGHQSKMVINGDKTQIDLPNKMPSGLCEVEKVLRNLRDIAMVYFTEEDVVRHDLVGVIIKAYERFYNNKETDEE